MPRRDAGAAGPALDRLADSERKAKTYYLIGDDYVWPRKINAEAKTYIGEKRRQSRRRGICAVRRAEQIRGSGDPNQVGQAGLGLITLVGADNVNFNRTFAGFGLDKDISRLAFLLEENTLMGVGAESSANLYSCMGYFANDPSAANTKFKAAYSAKFGARHRP